MKKFLSVLILVAAVVLSGTLVGCQTAQPTATTAPTKAPTSAPVATAVPTVAPTAAPTAVPTAVPTVGPKSGGVLKIGAPGIGGGGNFKDKTWTVGQTAYQLPAIEALVGVDENGLTPNKLATSWDVAADGKSITFHLRQGVKFHDGTDFNAEAVKWNLEKIIPLKGELKVITAVEVVDTYTVKLNLSKFSNTLLYHLSWYDGVMVSPASVEGRDAEYVANHIVGTGPFKMVKYLKDTGVVYEKFADYWDKGKPYLDGIEYVLIKDANTARNALLTGQVDVLDYVAPKDVADIKSQGKYNVNTAPGLMRIGYTDSGNADSPYAKKEVRYALEYAIDKQALADVFGLGTWEAPVGPCSVFHVGCGVVTAANARNYDPAKAKQLLADAGYPNGFKTVLYSQASTNQELVAAIQGYLRAVGIEAELQLVDGTKMSTLRTEGWQNGMLIQGISTSTSSYIQALETDGPSPTKAKSALVSPGYSALLKEATAATDPAVEKTLSEQLVKLALDEAVILPFVVESRNAVYGEQIHLDLNNISIWFWNPADAWMNK